MTNTATIDQLKPGSEYPGGNINSRKSYAPDQIKKRLESIVTFGVLQSLCVCPAPGTTEPPYYVAAGGLRREAIILGIKTKKLPADFAIPVTVRDDLDGAMALAASLEENDQVLAPHPVQTFEQFVELQSRGKSAEDIAKLFRLETKEVQKILALGKLSPKIRKAWLDDEIASHDAKAFTLAKDAKHQDDVFDRLKKQHNLQGWAIRRAFTGDNNHDAAKFLKLVGRDTYETAGGKMQEDLFSERESDKMIVQDFPLLIRLAGEKIEEKCKALVEAGWAWACDKDDIKNFYSLGRAPNASASLSKELKAKSGCVVEVDHNGKLDITYGVLKAGVKVGKVGSAKAGKTEASKPSNVLSNSLRQDLVAMAARATKDALIADKYGDDVAITLAHIIAAQITPDRFNCMPSAVREKLPAIRNGLTPTVMTEALQKRFDRQRYFANAPKTFVLRAITESVSAEQAKKLTPGTKAAAWKFALANVPKTWLPPELRTAHYAGPGGKASNVTKLKAKAKPAKASAPKRKAA